MLVALLAAVALAVPYWLLVPTRFRPWVLSAASLAGLGFYDLRLIPVLLGLVALLFWGGRAISYLGSRWRAILTGFALALLAAFFAWNKRAATGGGVLATQQGLVLLGVSYVVLKAAAVLIESARGSLKEMRLRDVLLWIVFLPIYPSGPIEEFEHFRAQAGSFDGERVFAGLERILIGLVKALLLSHYIGAWADPILGSPDSHGRLMLLLAVYAFTLRFYFDFAGYSDIAIGLSAVFGYEIQENFANPLLQRNIVQLWQRWHMTLTRWLRTYIFLPLSRGIMRRASSRFDRGALSLGQIVTMTACGAWHGLGWNFVLWGAIQGIGLVWVGLFAPELARLLPRPLLNWWRRSRTGYALSTFITVNVFAGSTLFLGLDLGPALSYLARLVGVH